MPLTSTTLALYGQDPVEGNLVPLTGSGTYTSGGTITPALGDGSILIGRDATREHSSPPRIVLVPRNVTARPRSVSIANGRRNEERRAEIQQRPIGNDAHGFDVHAWGASSPPDAANDYMMANALRECVRTSLVLLACGTSSADAGVWDDQSERATQAIKAGHLLTFGITIAVPVLDNPILGGLPFVPVGTLVETTVQTTTPEVAAILNTTIEPA